MSKRWLVAVAVCAVLAVAGCRDDGRTLADAPPPLPTTAPPVVEEAATTGPSVPFSLSSPGVDDGQRMHPRHTCDGDGIAPIIDLVGIPSSAVELAVVLVDETAAGYVHWVVAGIPATTARLDATTLADPALVRGRTSGGVTGWEGPCPPDGPTAHAYTFTVYAFAEPLGLRAGIDGSEAVGTLATASFASASLTAFYGGDG